MAITSYMSTYFKPSYTHFMGGMIPELLPTEGLPTRYLINGNATVCYWGKRKYVSKFNKDKEILEDYDRELGFLYCCYQRYKRDWSRNKRLRILDLMPINSKKEFLIEIFMEENNMSRKEAKNYLKQLKCDNFMHHGTTHKRIRKGE